MSETLPNNGNIQTPEAIWVEKEDEITKDFNSRLVPLMALRSYGIKDVNLLPADKRSSLQEEAEFALQAEKNFVEYVARNVLNAKATVPDASEYIVLFDVDETLTSNIQEEGGNIHVLRPAALPLLESLHHIDSRITFGLLTTIQKNGLDELLGHPNGLGEIAPYLDRKRVISVHDAYLDKNMPKGYCEEIQPQYQADHLDPLPEGVGVTASLRAKVLACENILRESGMPSVVHVDDLRGMAQVTKDERFYPVPIGQGAGFSL